MTKFHHWVHLNEEGKRLFGSVFPDGIVPVQIMLSQDATLQGQNGIQRVYKVDWEQLSNEQREEILEILSQKFGAPKGTIRSQFEKDGFIPLRAQYVSGAGTDQIGLFI
jgi:hypothetical protein